MLNPIFLKAGPFTVRVFQRADGLYEWEASTPGYLGWSSQSTFGSIGRAKIDVHDWLRKMAKEISETEAWNEF